MPIGYAITGFLVSFLSGGLAGAVLTLWVTGRRNKAQKRDDFRGFLQRWKTRILAPSRGPDVVRAVADSAVTAYDAGLPDFQNWVERVRSDFKGAQRFEVLTSKLGSLKREDWQNRQSREVITEAIDELIKFLA